MPDTASTTTRKRGAAAEATPLAPEPTTTMRVLTQEEMDEQMGVESATPGNADRPTVGMQALLGRETFSWKSPFDESIRLKFRRAKGGTMEMIYRVLGPEQAQNSQVVRNYTAIASIIEINGDRVAQPISRAGFTMLMKRLAKDDFYDEPLACFVAAYEYAMNPTLYEMMGEAEAAGLSPDDIKRIYANAGLEHAKK